MEMKSIEIPDSVKTIDVRAFAACPLLEKVVIPEGTETIGFGAFMMCSNLTDLTIPESVKSIGPTAFSGCPKLTIHGYAGSSAETYAEQYGLTFEAIEQGDLLKGDVNGDNVVDVEDAQLTLNAYVKIMAKKDHGLTERRQKAADVNGDETISVDDAQYILNYYVKNRLAGSNVTWDQILK